MAKKGRRTWPCQTDVRRRSDESTDPGYCNSLRIEIRAQSGRPRQDVPHRKERAAAHRECEKACAFLLQENGMPTVLGTSKVPREDRISDRDQKSGVGLSPVRLRRAQRANPLGLKNFRPFLEGWLAKPWQTEHLKFPLSLHILGAAPSHGRESTRPTLLPNSEPVPKPMLLRHSHVKRSPLPSGWCQWTEPSSVPPRGQTGGMKWWVGGHSGL